MVAPTPYIAQKGPYKKLCLLSMTPFVTAPYIISITYPKILYNIKYEIILHMFISYFFANSITPFKLYL